MSLEHGSVDLDQLDHRELWITSGDVAVSIRFTEEACPSCSCDWLDWNGRYLCGYQAGKGRARHRCETVDAWREPR